ncbi:Protein CBG26294 [Caenorhabditis briggsae]|uniref:Protein CBG26294 n=1 Tax=Caenorhabditis briggsae TaxID=6238 RepID=B6IG67_CAEBR|nr:Protein CBG26294 [Caenorhabditis briggsae]CAR98897.1 Protein CBG26294 [Caenorhabditis briggsae]
MLSISQRSFYKEEYQFWFLLLFGLIICLNILSILYYFFNLIITIRVKHYKTNLAKIHQEIYVSCPISSTIVIVEKVLDIMGKRRANYIQVFVAFHMFLSTICYFISFQSYLINRSYYYKNRVTKAVYPLAERYQIAENIRMYQFFDHFLIVLAVFVVFYFFFACILITFFCIACILITHYDSVPIHREILCVVFDLSFTLLCIIAPYLILKKRIMAK